MKKMILTALLLSLISTSAMAVNYTGSTTIGSMTYSTSNKVYLKGASATTSYFFESLHVSGSRTFATDNVASLIYWKENTGGNSSYPFTSGATAATVASATYTNKL